jgi:Ca-activated chloride channel family protein
MLLAAMTPLAVDRLTVQGGTNLESGLVLGCEEAVRAFRPAATNRVVLRDPMVAEPAELMSLAGTPE